MKLGDLLREMIAQPLPPEVAALEVSGVQEDSRQVRAGDLFVALAGLHVDGRDFAAAAVQRGAVAVVARRAVDGLAVPCVLVADPARALALGAARLAGEPARRLELIGITGTNGKTTTTYLIEAILAAAGHRPGVVGTVTYRYAGCSEVAPYTTPTAPVLQDVLRRMAEAGCSHVVAEVSSHALQLGRVWGLEFVAAGFTHLTQDHLDLHGSMEAYLQAKLLLFARHLRPGGAAVINLDGAGAAAVLEVARRRGDVRVIGCSTAGRPGAEARITDLECTVAGLRGTLHLGDQTVALRSHLLGAYNADNILMAATLCHAVGVPPGAVAAGVAAIHGVPGRLERVDHAAGDFAVLVDYAHTPDALERALGVLRPLCRGRLIVVFGCGGDRDRTKRPLMGAAVARDADLAVVTSDNPRSEEPLAIIEEIVAGVRGGGAAPAVGKLAGVRRGYVVQPDRRQAIDAAVQAAQDGDIVLVAGKGHEDYQILRRPAGSGDAAAPPSERTYKIHFDDREEARAALTARAAGGGSG